MNKLKNLYEFKTIIIIATMIILVIWGTWQCYKIKIEIENPIPSILYDKKGKSIINISSQQITMNDVPSFTKDYINKGKKHLEIPDLLFAEHPLKRIVSKMWLISYNETQLKDIYLNHLYFQTGILGIENASHYYFNKGIIETTLSENIFLLSKTKKVHKNTEKNVKVFIESLYKDNLISDRERVDLIMGIPELIDSLYHQETFAQSYIEYVIREIETKFDMVEQEFFHRGYSTYTTMDRKVQKNLYEKISHAEIVSERPMKSTIEAGMVVLNHHTGEIPGLIGGIDYQASSMNRAFEGTRQPASTFKPLMVYGPAIDKGWKATDTLKDTPMRFGDFRPMNPDRKFRDKVTIEEALTHSYNVPAVWLLNKIGFEVGLHYIEKFNLFPINKSDGLSLALGFTSVGTSPLAIAQAYSVFPHEGKMVDAYSIKRIENVNGRNVYKEKGNETKLFEEQTAKTMTKLLTNVVESGTGEKAKMENQPISGKTGTTSYDAWFVGYNDQYVGAIWTGPDEVIPQNRMAIVGEDTPQTLFKRVFSDLE